MMIMREGPAAFPVGTMVVTIVLGRRCQVIQFEAKAVEQRTMGGQPRTAEEVAKLFHDFGDAITRLAKEIEEP